MDYSADDTAIKAQLKAQLGSDRRKASGTVKGRKQAERSAMRRPDDGRLSHRGETAQLNVGVEREWKAWLAKAKQDHGMDLYEIVERGLALVRAELEGKRNA
jgi:hypothetical protein